MPTESIPEIAYILKGFPRLSETFIANEVYLLEQKGLRLRVYSVKTSSENKVHPVVEKINAPVTYLPGTTSLSQTSFIPWFRENFPKFAAAHKALFQSRPMAYCKTLLQAIRMVFKYRDGALAKPRKVFLKEFMQAGYIALEILQANNVQHLHGHFSHGSTTITLFVSQLTGLPFSFTAHAKDIYQKKLNPGNLLRKKLNAATFVVTCTKSNKEYLEQLCSSKEKVKAIYHGLDTGFFLPGNHASEIETPLILSVGRFVEKKGFSYLIESCRSLKDLGLNFKCVIVGEKDDQFEKIQRMIQSLDLMDTVQLQSEMTQRELLEVYRKATLFALPCQILSDGDRDGIPNVLIEAMAMGVPVVSTSISGIPELIKNDVNGVLVPQRDTAALTEALRRLLSDNELRLQLARASRDTVCHSFDSQRTMDNLKQLFSSNINPCVPA